MYKLLKCLVSNVYVSSSGHSSDEVSFRSALNTEVDVNSDNNLLVGLPGMKIAYASGRTNEKDV